VLLALVWVSRRRSARSAAAVRFILGDSVNIAFGSVGLTAGLLFALYILGKGIDISAQRKYSLAEKWGQASVQTGTRTTISP
jgi:hypothetical protein